jgi:hypothetical protein
MSTAYGIAAVTATLRELLNDGIVEHNPNGISAARRRCPRIALSRPVASNPIPARKLHRVSANTGWRNEGLPARDASGRQRLSNAPLALDLHYLLSAYGAGELHAEVLLGYAMQWLHERPMLTREAILAALTPSPLPGTPLERALADSGLADQIESITPEYLDTEGNQAVVGHAKQPAADRGLSGHRRSHRSQRAGAFALAGADARPANSGYDTR